MAIYNPVNPTVYGATYQRLKATEVLHVPETTTLEVGTSDTSAQIRVSDGKLWYYTGGVWKESATAGGLASKFGKTGEDAAAGENRDFNFSAYNFNIHGTTGEFKIASTDVGGLKLKFSGLVENPLSMVLYIDPTDSGRVYYGNLPAPVGRFGINDILGVQDRAIDMETFGFEFNNISRFKVRALNSDSTKDGYFNIDYDGVSGYAIGSSGAVAFMWGNMGVDAQSNILQLSSQRGMIQSQSGNADSYDGVKAYMSTYNKEIDAVVQVGAYGFFGGGSSLMRFAKEGVALLGSYDEFYGDTPVMGEGMSAYPQETSTIEGYEVMLYRSIDGMLTRGNASLIGGGGGGTPSKFGKAGEDDIATENRSFDLKTFDFYYERNNIGAGNRRSSFNITDQLFLGSKDDTNTTGSALSLAPNQMTIASEVAMVLNAPAFVISTVPEEEPLFTLGLTEFDQLVKKLYTGGGGGGVGTTNIYYVSPSGNDSNNGLSMSAAWATIAKVNAATLIPGDTVLFEGGKTWTSTADPNTLQCKGGAAGNRITYGSYGSGRATLLGNNQASIYVSDGSYLTIRDLILQGINHPSDQWGKDGLYVESGWGVGNAVSPQTDISFINLKIDSFGGMGIGLWAQSATAPMTNLLIEGCEISGCMNGCYFFEPEVPIATGYSYINPIVRNCKFYNNFGASQYADNHSGSGIVMTSTSGGLIEQCEAYGNGWKNFDAFAGPHGIWMADCLSTVIRNCESHHNGTIAPPNAVDGGGFDMDGGCQNCVIEYCYSHDNSGCGYALFEWGSVRPPFTNNIIRYCISVNDSRLASMGGISIWTSEAGFNNNKIHNNLIIVEGDSIISGSATAMEFIGGSYGTLNIVNNIFIIDGANINLTTGTVGGTWSNNIIYAMNGANLNYTTGCTTANPMLINITGEAPLVGAYAQKGVRGSLWNYQLRASSPAMNTGTSTISGYTFPTRDFWGLITPSGVRNIGPHELVTY